MLPLYDVAAQNVQAGGKAGCSAAVVGTHVLPGLVERRWRRVLFLSTGALMSQDNFLQGESIPALRIAWSLAARKRRGTHELSVGICGGRLIRGGAMVD